MNCCANCGDLFTPKAGKKGYHRQSLENIIPGTTVTARDAFCLMGTEPLTPAQSKRAGKFLCNDCWMSVCHAYKSQEHIKALWKKTTPAGYISTKRKRFTSTPTKTPRKLKTPRKVLL